MYLDQKFKHFKRKTKYGNKSTVFEGKRYDSKFEAKVAQDLAWRVKAKELTHFDTQVTIPLVVNGMKICTYRIDFVAYRTDGITEYIEAKGYETPLWKFKWSLFEALWKDEKDCELIVIRLR